MRRREDKLVVLVILASMCIMWAATEIAVSIVRSFL